MNAVEIADAVSTLVDQSEIDFENEGGETYICGNPPYLGSTWQSAEQKADLKTIFDGRTKSWKSLDYVAGWFMKAADYGFHTPTASAFVSTNSICQGQQVPILWPLIFSSGHAIHFAHTSFKWANLASHNAGVTVAIVGISNHAEKLRSLYSISNEGDAVVREAENVNAYLVAAGNVIVEKLQSTTDERCALDAGGKPVEGGHLFTSFAEKNAILARNPSLAGLFKRAFGASEYIRGDVRHCLWIKDSDLHLASADQELKSRMARVAEMRLKSPKAATKKGAKWPHRFEESKQTGNEIVMIVPKVSSESREYLPVGLLPAGSIVTDLAFALYDAPLWNMALIASRIHLVWIATVCGKMKTDFRYSNTLGWNTFPVPVLTAQNKTDLTRCAEDILLARESHFPATIAELYDPAKMPTNLRAAHDRNDETLERIYLGRRFKNDTERLEKLFELYTKMTANAPAKKAAKPAKGRKA